MKYLFISLFAITLLIGFSCNSTNDYQLKVSITEHIYYDNLSSASGVSLIDNHILLVGDDIPWLVQLNDELVVEKKTQLSGIDSIVAGRTPYSIKADYECMETFNDDGILKTLVLSSGSKLNSRDTAILISYGDSLNIQKRNIRSLFEKIKKMAKIGDEEINIEGLALTDQKAYLFHRGNISGNFIIEMKRTDFLHFIEKGESNFKDISLYQFDLPIFNEVASGFSGACYSDCYNSILFTASMEDTKTVTADGEVLGSYIGIIPIDKIDEGIYYSTLLKKDDIVLAKKLEGISIEKSDGNEINVISICDNDDGSSDLFRIRLTIF